MSKAPTKSASKKRKLKRFRPSKKQILTVVQYYKPTDSNSANKNIKQKPRKRKAQTETETKPPKKKVRLNKAWSNLLKGQQ